MATFRRDAACCVACVWLLLFFNVEYVYVEILITSSFLVYPVLCIYEHC